MLIVSSTEPLALRKLLPPHRLSTMPERFGADVMWNVKGEWWGVQRKTVKDLVASVLDGRLAKEMGQMQQLAGKYLIIEGTLTWTTQHSTSGTGGDLLTLTTSSKYGTTNVTRRQLNGIVWSVQNKGVHVEYTRNCPGTAGHLSMLLEWSRKEGHSSLTRRPSPAGKWGTPSNREYGEWVLQGFPGVGPEIAKNVWEMFGGVPLQWTVDLKELATVKGVGKGKAQTMLDALRGVETTGVGNE